VVIVKDVVGLWCLLVLKDKTGVFGLEARVVDNIPG